MNNYTETQIRITVFQWIKEKVNFYGGSIPRKILEQGFEIQRKRITLIGPSGIWKPVQFDQIPLSITSAPSVPYDDSFTNDGLLLYKYRGTDINHRDNVGLREAMRTRTPLIYFHGIIPGLYVPVWPVFITDDTPDKLSFLVAIDPAYAIDTQFTIENGIKNYDLKESSIGIRKYIASYTLKRLHQTEFRETVITAYNSTCSFCRIKHRELLDAAHIIPDAHPKGDPIVQNGLCLCKIHHAAYDSNIVGISPNYIIHIRKDILDESDGPMLLHGLQSLNNIKLIVPNRKQDRPDPDRLEIRYNEFLKAI